MSAEDKTERLHIHIAGLEATLTKRNQEIERLRGMLDAEGDSPTVKRARDRGYKEGWKACAGTLMEVTRKTANDLGAVHRSAFEAYLEGDRMNRDAQ